MIAAAWVSGVVRFSKSSRMMKIVPQLEASHWKKAEKPGGPDLFQVGYRATSFRDARGRTHVDARRAEVSGPLADEWSPDSFAFGARKLWTCDDAQRGHQADIGETIPAATRGADYRALLRQVQALAEGGL